MLDCKKTILVKKWLRTILSKTFLALKPKFLRFRQNKKNGTVTWIIWSNCCKRDFALGWSWFLFPTKPLCYVSLVDWNKTLLKVVSVMKSYQFLPFRCLYRIRSKYPHYMYITYVCSWYVYIYALHLPIFYSGKIAFSTYLSSIPGAPGG